MMVCNRPSKNARLILCLLATIAGHGVESTHFTDLFPQNDEYDFKILDPNTIHGSPFGGFSRATRSRLAALPLPLPFAPEEPADEVYEEVRDYEGRPFVCRVYHEDELDASTLDESVFTTPVEKGEVKQGEGSALDSPEDGLVAEESENEIIADEEVEEEDDVMDNEESASSAEPATQVPVSRLSSHAGVFGKIDEALSALEGICTQIHRGWWSYEWCHEKRVTQFHIHVNDRGAGANVGPDLRLDSITNIGRYSTRMVMPSPASSKHEDDEDDDEDDDDEDDDDEDDDDEDDDEDFDAESLAMRNERHYRDSVKTMIKPFSQGETPLGVVYDDFPGGDKCPATGKPRSINVEFHCCSLSVMRSFNSAVIIEGETVPSSIAALVRLDETEVCVYHAVICTPLLCEGKAEMFRTTPSRANSKGTPAPKKAPRKRRPRKANESIRETIDRVLDDRCLRSNTNDWWAYEFCHGDNVRQFHESNILDSRTGITARGIETEYNLGFYPADELENFPREQEIDYVVNATNDVTESSFSNRQSRASTASQRGNGAYFKQEYKRGDVCDDSDVTDAAITAGSTAGGKLERGSTIRFFCGPKLELIEINEDSTCHYIVDVTIPDLCDNLLFKAPVLKRQVMKCLPVPVES